MLFFSVTEHPRALTYNHNNSALRSQDVTHKHLTFNRALMWEINADECYIYSRCECLRGLFPIFSFCNFYDLQSGYSGWP